MMMTTTMKVGTEVMTVAGSIARLVIIVIKLLSCLFGLLNKTMFNMLGLKILDKSIIYVGLQNLKYFGSTNFV